MFPEREHDVSISLSNNKAFLPVTKTVCCWSLMLEPSVLKLISMDFLRYRHLMSECSWGYYLILKLVRTTADWWLMSWLILWRIFLDLKKPPRQAVSDLLKERNSSQTLDQHVLTSHSGICATQVPKPHYCCVKTSKMWNVQELKITV